MTKEEVKNIWRLCFDDSEEFIEMYFRLRYNNEVSIGITSGEELIAALQMLPYPMTFGGKTIETSYISGACTHPDYRGNGVMRELLSQAYVRMLHKGALISTLIPGEPWLFDYYARMGYAAVFRYSQRKELQSCKSDSSAYINVKCTGEYEEAVYQYLHKKMLERPCCIQHTETDFKVILADLSVTHDSLYVATQEDEVKGIAMTYREKDTLWIAELLADSPKIENDLLKHIRQTTGCDKLTIIAPAATDEESYPLGMARILDARAVLQLYAASCPKDEMNIELTDEQLTTNNGYYYLCKGKCMYSNQRLPGAHIQLTIGELSQKILAPLQPYMSLMME